VIDMGPGAGEHGGRIVTAGPPQQVASHPQSATAPFLRTTLEEMSITASA
jgi:excinuclease ABC subunit A